MSVAEASWESIRRLTAKVLVRDGARLFRRGFISVFHGWIREHRIPEHVLIDVHDYTHLHHGPGVMLVAHEGHFRSDEGGGRLGLLYARKRGLAGGFEDRLRMTLRPLLQAATLLEAQGVEGTGVEFMGEEIILSFDDRLVAGADDGIAAGARVASTLSSWGAGPVRTEALTQPAAPLAFRIFTPEVSTIAAWLKIVGS